MHAIALHAIACIGEKIMDERLCTGRRIGSTVDLQREECAAPARSVCLQSTTFHRHSRQLRAVMLESQAWFSMGDLGRLMGINLHDKTAQKLDPDQHRTAWLGVEERWEKCVIVSESGAYALLVHHYIPENRALRHWLTYTVLPVLRATVQDQPAHLPEQTMMRWEGMALSFLHWQGEPWIRLRDLPVVIQQPLQAAPSATGWWRRAWGS